MTNKVCSLFWDACMASPSSLVLTTANQRCHLSPLNALSCTGKGLLECTLLGPTPLHRSIRLITTNRIYNMYFMYWLQGSLHHAVNVSVCRLSCFLCNYVIWQQVAMEIPYVLMLALLFMLIAYPTIGYAWTAAKFCWFFYTMFCTLLYFVYFGMLIVSITPNLQVASIYASSFYMTQHLLSGFVMPPSVSHARWYLLFLDFYSSCLLLVCSN